MKHMFNISIHHVKLICPLSVEHVLNMTLIYVGTFPVYVTVRHIYLFFKPITLHNVVYRS